jgi:hypothetical protein
MVLARAYAPPCSGSDDTTTTRRERSVPRAGQEERQFILRSIERVWVGMKSGDWPRNRVFEWLAGAVWEPPPSGAPT